MRPRAYLPTACVFGNLGTKRTSNNLVTKADSNDLGSVTISGELVHKLDQVVDPGDVGIGVAS